MIEVFSLVWFGWCAFLFMVFIPLISLCAPFLSFCFIDTRLFYGECIRVPAVTIFSGSCIVSTHKKPNDRMRDYERKWEGKNIREKERKKAASEHITRQLTYFFSLLILEWMSEWCSVCMHKYVRIAYHPELKLIKVNRECYTVTVYRKKNEPKMKWNQNNIYAKSNKNTIFTTEINVYSSDLIMWKKKNIYYNKLHCRLWNFVFLTKYIHCRCTNFTLFSSLNLFFSFFLFHCVPDVMWSTVVYCFDRLIMWLQSDRAHYNFYIVHRKYVILKNAVGIAIDITTVVSVNVAAVHLPQWIAHIN